MTPREQLLTTVTRDEAFIELNDRLDRGTMSIRLESLAGSAYTVAAAATIRKRGGVHILVADDRDAAAYAAADLYALLDAERVMFLPTSYKRSIQFGQEDAGGSVQRTAALNAIRNFHGGYLAVCTYPEALAETVVAEREMNNRTITVSVGEHLSHETLVELLEEAGFERVDFVYEPGQYLRRGGIVDLFSYSESRPFRVDFFGDEVDSIRSFEISSQLSKERLNRIEIIPNLREVEQARVSVAEFAGAKVCYWIDDPLHAARRMNDIRKRLLSDGREQSEVDERVVSGNLFMADSRKAVMLMHRSEGIGRVAECTIDFATSPQPAFNKNFALLADDLTARAMQGFTSYILSENKAQIERLTNVFRQTGRASVRFSPLSLTLHEGFVWPRLKMCCYTDHQIFDRYHRYRLRGEIARDESLTVAELNALKVGDYVVHVDHGVGRFGGLVKTVENGKQFESIKLVYRDGDVLLVNVHSLHRIARYKAGDSEPPKIYKLGTGAWQKLKNATKKAVKDIARELIALYAKRKATPGFAFSADGYLQHELEASFEYEDTPDQQKAVEAIKQDMESTRPMDRLVCGDVGFGKTEVAVRAAFKAVTDGKQVAVLVPTTILSLQHYRTFSHRLREFPVRIEHLSRTKSTRDVTTTLADLEAGKIDILIGTHKILGKNVKFKDLGLLIIDEEQKFGVGAKEKLRQMSVNVDTLTLTATPIPRTLQFSLMGSRDLSVISTPPPNRQPIVTESHLFGEEIIREAIEAELARGGQVYFVHNRIDDLLSIQGMIARVCPKARTAIGHGRMNAQDMEKLIMDFIYGEFDVLIATSIVENGIDIPNANTIIIDGAHKFGLSELHQMRGRVGRSDKKAYCYLLSPPEELLTDDARRRLRAIEEFSDLGSGFNIAMQDLDIRGAGNLLGAEQSGYIADIGFETYQKILAEAMAELRSEGVDMHDLPDAEQFAKGDNEVRYVDDTTIDTDVQALLPDTYIGQAAEKLRLYRELDNLTREEDLQSFEQRLIDRFGPLPREASELMNVVRLRREAIALGLERVKVKNGLMIVHFVANQQSPYFKSDTFMNLLRAITARPQKFVLRQNNNRLAMTVRAINSIESAWQTLHSLRSETAKTENNGAKN